MLFGETNGIISTTTHLEQGRQSEAKLRQIWEKYSAAQRQTVDHVKSLGCTAKVVVPRSVIERIKGYLNAALRTNTKARIYSIIYTIEFPDGKQTDIKCCGCQDEPS